MTKGPFVLFEQLTIKSQIAAEGQLNRMVPNMEMHMNKRCVIEFLHTGKNDIHQCVSEVKDKQYFG